MCLIINKPKNIDFPEEWLDNSFERNRDGWGVMWPFNNQVFIRKGFKLQELKDILEKLPSTMHIAIHMRAATHGEKDLINCHPIRVTKHIWAMHNGIISVPTPNKKWSDTKHFIEYGIKPILTMYPDLWGTEQLKDTIKQFAGGGNKLLLMHDNGSIMIINETAGSWKEKCWLSNTYSIEGRSKPNQRGSYEGGCYYGGGYEGSVNYYRNHGSVSNETKTSQTLARKWCNACKTSIECGKEEWSNVPGVGWICPHCYQKIEQELETGEVFSIEDLKLLTYQEIMEICENSPETIALSLIGKEDKKNEDRKSEPKLLSPAPESVGTTVN